MNKEKVKMLDVLVPTSMAVHDGLGHADDVFSVAVMTIINPNISVIRTRDEDKLLGVDMRVDVGGKYDPTTHDYDHHMEDVPRNKSFLWNGEEVQGPKYSGIGLIWKHFGKSTIQIIASNLGMTVSEDQIKIVHENIERIIITPIDIEDNNEVREYFGAPVSKYRPLSIGAIIQNMMPTLRDDNLDNHMELMEQAFFSATTFAQSILENNIRRQLNSVKDLEFLKEFFMNYESDDNVLIIPKICAWQYGMISLNRLRIPELTKKLDKIDFVVYPVPSTKSNGYNWMVQPTKAWSRKERQFTMKRPLAEDLRGKPINELVAITGIETISFVHPSGFLGGAVTQEDAVALARYSDKKFLEGVPNV